MHARVILAAAVLSALTTACGTVLTDALSGGAAGSRRPIDTTAGHGISLPWGADNEPTWSPDASQIIYTTRDDSGFTTYRAFTVSTGTSRVLDRERTCIDWISPSVSPTHVYMLVAGGDSLSPVPCRLYRVSLDGQPPEFLLDSVIDAYPSPDGVHVIYTPGSHVIYSPVSVDTGSTPELWVYDVTTRSRMRIGVSDGGVVQFSPDGARALLRAGSEWMIVTLADGALEPLSLGLAPGDSPSAVTWGPDGIRVFFGRTRGPMSAPITDYYVQQVGGGEAHQFYTEDFDGLATDFSWSRDGKTLAFYVADWRGHCAIYAVDVATGEESWVAGTNIDFELGMELSPENRWILYRFSDGWYVSPVPL